MLESLPFLLFLGTLLGFLSGIGIGGGSLLILWLTIVLEMEPSMARGINLLFFLPCALISCCFRWKQGDLQLKAVLPAIVSGVIFAALFSWLGVNTDTAVLKKAFGILLLITGIRELTYKKRERKG